MTPDGLRKLVLSITSQLHSHEAMELRGDVELLGDVITQAADEIESLRKRLELAEKVCEAADKWDSRDQHSLIPDTSDPAVKLGAVLEEWRKGDGK